jgi:hypothetical protein
LPGTPKFVRPHAMLPAFGLVVAGVPEVYQGVQAAIGQGKHVPSPPAIASAGSTKFFKLFVAKSHAPAAPIACGNVYPYFVYKFHGRGVFRGG